MDIAPCPPPKYATEDNQNSATFFRLQAIYDTKSMEDKVAKASYSIPLLMGKKWEEDSDKST